MPRESPLLHVSLFHHQRTAATVQNFQSGEERNGCSKRWEWEPPPGTHSCFLLEREKVQPLKLWLFMDCLPERTWVFEMVFTCWNAVILDYFEHWINDSYCEEKGDSSYHWPADFPKLPGLAFRSALLRRRSRRVNLPSFCVCLSPFKTRWKMQLFILSRLFFISAAPSPPIPDLFSQTLGSLAILERRSGDETDHIPYQVGLRGKNN